jgi:hypothetical protein
VHVAARWHGTHDEGMNIDVRTRTAFLAAVVLLLLTLVVMVVHADGQQAGAPTASMSAEH